jgi:diguanylate cyclase (GGDEF)-like protein
VNTVALVLGRDSSCDIVAPDTTVSREHARVEPRGDAYFVVDLGSTNGTLINGEPIAERMLHDGDYLQVGGCIYRFLSASNVEAEYHEEIYRLTILDGLTGIFNKRYLLECLDRELARSARYGRPLAALLIDIDHFKRVNDQLGHLAGDRLLRQVADCIKATVRQEEVFARYGGEEFVLVLPEADLAAAVRVAERICQEVAACPLEYQGETHRVTVSVGVAVTEGHQPITAGALLQRADDRLYEAKRSGRNCVRS